MTTVLIGAGCFHFAPGKSWNGKQFNHAEFARQLKAALEAESNINNVHLHGFPGPAAVSQHDFGNVDENTPDIARGPGFFPDFGNATVSLDVFIPQRLQKELYRGSLRTGTENFHVSVTYDWYFPVAFVELVGASGSIDPSDGVVCVRKFLERKLGKNQNPDVEFQSLGPSPFHADFTLNIAIDDTAFVDECVCSIVPLSGYDMVHISVKTADPESEAKQLAFERLGKELQFYYHVVQAGVSNMYRWHAIENSIDSLQAKAMLPTAKRLFASFGVRRLIDKTLFQITDLERSALSVANEAKRWKTDVERVDGECFLWTYIETEVADVAEYPVEQMLRLLNIFEERRRVLIQNLAVVIGTIVGGAVGAGLAFALSGG